jgi:hypothetical protein
MQQFQRHNIPRLLHVGVDHISHEEGSTHNDEADGTAKTRDHSAGQEEQRHLGQRLHRNEHADDRRSVLGQSVNHEEEVAIDEPSIHTSHKADEEEDKHVWAMKDVLGGGSQLPFRASVSFADPVAVGDIPHE